MPQNFLSFDRDQVLLLPPHRALPTSRTIGRTLGVAADHRHPQPIEAPQAPAGCPSHLKSPASSIRPSARRTRTTQQATPRDHPPARSERLHATPIYATATTRSKSKSLHHWARHRGKQHATNPRCWFGVQRRCLPSGSIVEACRCHARLRWKVGLSAYASPRYRQVATTLKHSGLVSTAMRRN
jgi:hypothetical protein